MLTWWYGTKSELPPHIACFPVWRQAVKRRIPKKQILSIQDIFGTRLHLGCFMCEARAKQLQPRERSNKQYILSYVPGSNLLILGMVIPPLIGNPYNGYINPYYWVDDHPLIIWKYGEFFSPPQIFWCMPQTNLISRLFNFHFTKNTCLDDTKYIYIKYIYIYTWNLFVLYFGGWTLQNKALFKQNKGHLGSRYTYIYIIYIHIIYPLPKKTTSKRQKTTENRHYVAATSWIIFKSCMFKGFWLLVARMIFFPAAPPSSASGYPSPPAKLRSDGWRTTNQPACFTFHVNESINQWLGPIKYIKPIIKVDTLLVFNLDPFFQIQFPDNNCESYCSHRWNRVLNPRSFPLKQFPGPRVAHHRTGQFEHNSAARDPLPHRAHRCQKILSWWLITWFAAAIRTIDSKFQLWICLSSIFSQQKIPRIPPQSQS